MHASAMRDLGALARSTRQRKGMTQADLAERLQVSRDWVVRLEQGNPRLEVQRVLDALVALGLRLDVVSLEEPPIVDGFAHENTVPGSLVDPFDFLREPGGTP